MAIAENEKRNITFSVCVVPKNKHKETMQNIETCVSELEGYCEEVANLAKNNKLEDNEQLWHRIRVTFGSVGYFLTEIEKKTRKSDARAVIKALADSVLAMFYGTCGKKFTRNNYLLMLEIARQSLLNLRQCDEESMRKYFDTLEELRQSIA